MHDGPEPVDWQGAPLDCAACRFRDRRALGQCGQGWACVHDRYAKRIERFFLLNPELADACLSMPYFETRMNAARVASVFRLQRLLSDADPGVRAMAILRLPRKHAERRIKDPDRRVRIAVAHRLPQDQLLPMTADELTPTVAAWHMAAQPAQSVAQPFWSLNGPLRVTMLGQPSEWRISR